jgi:hypothetical protein
MDKNKSAVDEFLGDLKENDTFKQDDVFKEEVIEPKVEEKEEVLPFHKDPKIQKFIEKELDKRLKDYVVTEDKPQTQGAEDEFKDVIDSLTTAIGNDTPEKVSALNAFKNALIGLDKRATEKAINHLDEIQQRESEADKEAEEELENAFDNIEETFDVDLTSNNPIAKKTRQEFVSFVEKIAPKDKNGEIIDYPDMTSAWETFSEIQKSKGTSTRAKDLASRGMARSAETTVKEVPKAGWDAADAYIESLGK